MSEDLKSFRDIVDFNDHGRNAREGFDYQDHIGVSIILEMLLSDNIIEVWFESIDDIDLIFESPSGNECIEFVQVKHEDLQSRYSIPTITARDNGREGTSLFEKSLNSARCEEEAYFRIITSFDVRNELKHLKLDRDNKKRNSQTDKCKHIIESIKDRCGEVSAPDSTEISEWVKKCYWEVKPSKIEDLKNSNIRSLHQVVEENYPPSLLYPQLDDLYKKLLMLVKQASTVDLDQSPSKNKIKKGEVKTIIKDYIDTINEPKGLKKGLEKKMKRSGLPKDYVAVAAELRQKYMAKRYDVDYMQSDQLSDLEGEILDKLSSLKNRLDRGEVDEGFEFYNECCEEVKKVARDKFNDKNIPEYIALGLMYQVTNRCLHRFHKIEI